MMSTTTKVLSKIFLLAVAFVVFGATQYMIDGSLPDILLVQNWWLSLPCFFIPVCICWLFSNQNHRLFKFLPDYIRAGSIFLLAIVKLLVLTLLTAFACLFFLVLVGIFPLLTLVLEVILFKKNTQKKNNKKKIIKKIIKNDTI